MVKQLARPEFRTTTTFDKAHPGLSERIFNWCQDLEMELGNAGADNPIYSERRLRYAREFLSLFPDENANFHVSFVRAQGESLWRMGRRAEAEVMAKDVGMLETEDEQHLALALRERRVIITQDADFLRLHAAGRPHSGFIYAPQQTPIGAFVRGLILIYDVLSPEEMTNHVEFI